MELMEIKREVNLKIGEKMTPEEKRVAFLYYSKCVPLSSKLNDASKCYRHIGKLEYHLIELGMTEEDLHKIFTYLEHIGRIVQKHAVRNFEMIRFDHK